MIYEQAMSVACVAMGVIVLLALWERVSHDEGGLDG
jgi:hypothetical protein